MFCSGSALRINTKDTSALLGDDKFLALEEDVIALPKFSSDRSVDCIKGRFGPFRAHQPTKVPLWAALEMDRLQQCTVELPEWLHEEELKRMIEEEKAVGDKGFTKIPHHYIEIAFAFLTQSKAFSGDQRRKVRTVNLLRKLVEIRRSKITDGLTKFEISANFIMDVTNLTAAEVTCFRARSCHALDKFIELLNYQQVANKDSAIMSQEDTSGVAGQDSSTPLQP